MSTFSIRQVAGDSNSANDSGQTAVTNTANNFIRINAQAVAHNAAVVATTAPGTTPGDIIIYGSEIVYTDLIGISLACTLSALNSSTLTPQVYIKLLGADGGDNFVIPLIPGQIFTWLNPAATINGVHNRTQPNSTYDANNNAFTLGAGATLMLPPSITGNITSITATPDKFADVTISGTIELAV